LKLFERAVVNIRRKAQKMGMKISGMQDGEKLFSSQKPRGIQNHANHPYSKEDPHLFSPSQFGMKSRTVKGLLIQFVI